MKKQPNPTIKAYLLRSGFYSLLLVAVCVIPFALAQRDKNKTSSPVQRPLAANTPLDLYEAEGVSDALFASLQIPLDFYVVPPAYTGTPGNATFLGPLTTAERTYQLLIHENQLTDIVGSQITAISWRLPTSATSTWPLADVTFNNYDVYLSGSVPPAERNLLDFSANVVPPQTQVRSGSLMIPANSYPFGGSPNDFGPEITFNKPWLYAGGHLLVELRHTGFTGTSRSVDAAGTSVPGYGTDFSACWTGSYIGNSGSQGNFSIVRLTTLAGPTPTPTPTGTPIATPTATPAGQDLLLVPNTTTNTIVALDPQTGDLINANFISIANLPSGVKPHVLLHPDGQRVLISHQTQDVVYAYDLNGNFLGVFAPAGGPNTTIMDNVRGMAFHPTTGHFLVTSAAGTNINAVVEFNQDGQFLGTFIAPGAGGIVGPWSILFRGSDVLVSASGDNIYSYLYDGTPIGRWNVEDINFPEQITQAANTDILAAAFSSPSGVHEFTAVGNRIAIYNPVTGNRGVYELPNGNILTSNGSGVHEITRNNTLVRTIIAGSSYMISLVHLGPTLTPTPTATASPTATFTPTATPTATLPATPTATASPTATATGTPTATPTGTPMPTCTPGGGDGLLYALNDDSSGSFVYGFSVNEATGVLSPLAGFPVAAQNGGINSIVSERMVADQANLRLYVINDSSDTVSAWSINPATGALTPMPFSPIPLPTSVWNTIAVPPGGSPLVVANNATNGLVHSLVITPTTATPALGSPYNMGAGVAGFSSRFSQNGDYYYVGGNSGSNIGGFGVDAATGVLTALAGSPFPAGASNVLAYATDNAGRLFSVDSVNGLRAFTSSSGALTPVDGNPFPSGLTQRRFGIVHPSGNFYIVAGYTGNNVGSYQISGSGAATTLTPVAGSPFATSGTTANALASNAAGTFLYVANRISRNITTFSVNTVTGVLTFQSVQPSNTLGTIGAINGIAYVAGGGCPSPTPTGTPSATPTATPTATFTPTPTVTATFTPTPTATATFTPTPTATATSTPTTTPTGTPSCTPGWSAGANLPSVGVRSVGVYFPANGKFYAMGGRSSDVAGSDFMHPFEYDPGTNSWTTKAATYADNQVNNMACAVLTDAGTPYIYCVGGSAATQATATDRVFRYNPVTDVISPVASPWPGAMGTILPGGFSVFNNKLYILGGFNNPVGMVDTIYEFTPSPAAWVLKTAHLPAARGYIPTTTIGNFIYTGGGSMFDPTAILVDSTDSYRYDPVADSIITITSIPRATGETRALNINGQMWVMGGGRTAPNPSNEVDIYNPGTNSWSIGTPFMTARRNFPTDTDGSTRVWLAGGYAPTAPTDSMEIFGICGTPTPTPTATPTATSSPTATPTATFTPTATATATFTPTATATATFTPTATATATFTPTATATATFTPTATATATFTPTATATATATATPTATVPSRPSPSPRPRPTPREHAGSNCFASSDCSGLPKSDTLTCIECFAEGGNSWLDGSGCHTTCP